MTFKDGGKLELPKKDRGVDDLIFGVAFVSLFISIAIFIYYMTFASGCQSIPDWLPTPPPTVEPTTTRMPMIITPLPIDTSTPVPTWTRTPKPLPTAQPTQNAYSIRVRVSGIPEMTDQNKDQLNKQVLFCLKNGNDMILIVHRYYQPDWPVGEWWSTWRLEYLRNGENLQEVPHKLCGRITGATMTFSIDWSHIEDIVATCEESGFVERNYVLDHYRTWELSEDCGDCFPSASVATQL